MRCVHVERRVEPSKLCSKFGWELFLEMRDALRALTFRDFLIATLEGPLRRKMLHPVAEPLSDWRGRGRCGFRSSTLERALEFLVSIKV